MRIDEIDRKVTQSDIQQLEKFADSLFGKVGIDVEFTRHFLDRVNDERNVKQITMAELTRLFKQEFKRWGKQIAQLGPDAEAVMKDMATDVNMPFALQWDSQNKELDLVAKTVMRKKDFKTSDPEFAVEGDFVHAISRFMNKSTRPGMYKRAAEKFHEWLKDQAPYRHSLGYYAMEWGNQYKNVDWRNLKQAYEDMFGDAGLVEKLVKMDPKGPSNLKVPKKQTKYSKRKSALGQKDDINETVIMEGGSLPGVGAIHIDEIKPTLEKLEKELGIELQDFVLGSVGKRQFSGDIDVAINFKPEQLPDFIKKLEKSPSISDMAKSSVIMTKVPIVNFDKSKSDGRPRTGFVQLDFMPGDPGWLKTYYHSPREDESKYKGVFRNIMLATIAAVKDRNDSDKKLEDGRPLESERYMFSPRDGLVRIRRTPVPNKAGTGYTKKDKNEIIAGPWKNTQDIVEKLGLSSVDDLNSFESLLDAVKKNFTKTDIQYIIQGFIDNNTVKDIGIPDELKDTK